MAFLAKLNVRAVTLVLAWGLAFAAITGNTPAAETSREYSLKAVFLYNFCQFIEWPETSFASPTAPLIIGVIGDDPFGALLDETVQGEVLRGHPLRVERYRRSDDAGRCHLLFIPASEAGRAGSIVASLRGRSIVTVGESEGFLSQGGMIALVTEGSRVRLRINQAPLRAASLRVSSKLLRVADTSG